MLLDQVTHLVLICGDGFDGRRLVIGHQPREADGIGVQDRAESSLGIQRQPPVADFGA